MPAPKKLFISHAKADQKFLEKLVAVLRENDLPLWHSRRHILGAQQWHDEIGAALRSCDWFILILSPAAVRSKWVKNEIVYALQSDRYKSHIVPILTRDCEFEKLSWVLPSIQFVDFSKDFEDGCRNLLKIWGKRHNVSQPSRQNRPRRG
jgi:hypothetical protein